MPNIKASCGPTCDHDEEHVVRRLGWALVRQWKEIPPNLQELLKQQAVYVEDRSKTNQLEQQINAFLRKFVP